MEHPITPLSDVHSLTRVEGGYTATSKDGASLLITDKEMTTLLKAKIEEYTSALSSMKDVAIGTEIKL